MALPTDAAPETFRSGTEKQASRARSATGSSPSISATSMPGLPVETMPIARRAPTPHYGRIAAVALLLAGLLTGGAWMTVRALSGPEPVEPVATPEPEAPTPVAAPPAPTTTAATPVADTATTDTATAETPTTDTATSPTSPPETIAVPTSHARHAPRGPTPVVREPEATPTPAPREPAAPAPEPEARPAAHAAPTSPSIVADQNEFCRAMGTCP